MGIEAVLDEIHAANGLLMVVYTGDGWGTADAWSYIGSHIPHADYVSATGVDWLLALPNVFIVDLETLQVIAKDQGEEYMTPGEILAAVEGNDT